MAHRPFSYQTRSSPNRSNVNLRTREAGHIFPPTKPTFPRYPTNSGKYYHRSTAKRTASPATELARHICTRMSAYGYKQTFRRCVIYVRSTPESGHSESGRGMSVNDPKRTLQLSALSLLLLASKPWRFLLIKPNEQFFDFVAHGKPLLHNGVIASVRCHGMRNGPDQRAACQQVVA